MSKRVIDLKMLDCAWLLTTCLLLSLQITVASTINYGASCVSNGTCKNSNTDCYSTTCRCDPGYFWKDTTCLPNANLSPGNVNTERLSTAQLRVTWSTSSYPEVVTGYLVELSPIVSVVIIVITGTSATISSLTPGERYTITVKSRSNYLNRGETAAAGAVIGITNPSPTAGLTPASSLMEPEAKIHFYKAEGRADSYTVTLTGDSYNMTKRASGPGDTLSAFFPGVSAGLYYNLTIITISFNVSSDPFTQIIQVRTGSDPVVDLSVIDVTSRSATLSWKRPINTNGTLHKYGIEVFNSSTCMQRINIQCTECLQPMTEGESFETNCKDEINIPISRSELDDVNFEVLYDVSLLPSTLYNVVVAAYNEEGKGQTDQEPVQTGQEAPGAPTEFRHASKTSESVELTWTPPEPRPGGTNYLIRVYELDLDKNQSTSFRNTNNLGYYNVTVNITGLSGNWKYGFDVFAWNREGVSSTVHLSEVITDESAPIAVENLQHQPIDGVYNQYQLSWRCPQQKDGRNGVIRSATVIKSSFTQSVNRNPEVGKHDFDNTDCTWSETITVTPEFNYTFEVYISNSIKGESTTIQRYMPAGPPWFLSYERSIIQVDRETETENSVNLVICPTCLLDNTNGVIIKSGILVCAKGDCPIGDVDEVKNADDFDKSPNWDTSSGVSFMTWYRVTEDDWLKGKEASEGIRFVLGGENCGVQDQNRFCNGPLPIDRTYRVWLFACTRVSCSEGDHLEFTLDIHDDSLPISIIAGIAIAAVLVVLAVVLLVVYIKVVRPRSQRQRRTQSMSNRSQHDEASVEIAGGNRLSVIQDGRPEADMKDCPPRSENSYDQLRVYSNQGYHDYERIEDTRT